jgi:hypothetical protein
VRRFHEPPASGIAAPDPSCRIPVAHPGLLVAPGRALSGRPRNCVWSDGSNSWCRHSGYRSTRIPCDLASSLSPHQRATYFWRNIMRRPASRGATTGRAEQPAAVDAKNAVWRPGPAIGQTNAVAIPPAQPNGAPSLLASLDAPSYAGTGVSSTYFLRCSCQFGDEQIQLLNLATDRLGDMLVSCGHYTVLRHGGIMPSLVSGARRTMAL